MCRYVNGQNQEAYECLKELDTTLTLDLGTCGPQQVEFKACWLSQQLQACSAGRVRQWVRRERVQVGFQHCHRDGVDWVFVTHPSYVRPGAKI